MLEWQCKKEASIHRTTKHFSINRKPRALGCRLLNCLPRTRTARSNDQLLRGSALLPRPSTLKFASLPLVSVASLCLVFYARRRFALCAHLPPPRRNFYTVMFKFSMVEWQRKNKASIHRSAKHFLIGGGGRNREKKYRISRISPHCGLY